MTRWTVRVVVVAVAAVVVIVIATAGSGPDSSGDPEATIAGPDPEQMAAFRNCLNEHGVKLARGSERARDAAGAGGLHPHPARGRGHAPGAESQDPARARGLLRADAHAARGGAAGCADPAGLGRCRPSSSSTTSGTVEAANAPGGGATFALRLPTDGAAPA